MVLFAKMGQSIDEERKRQLIEYWVDKLYIPKEVYSEALSKIKSNLGDILSRETIPLEHRASILHDTTRDTLRETLDTRFPAIHEKTLETLNDLVKHSFNFVTTEDAMKSLGLLIRHDNATYVHSLNVFLYSLTLFSGIDDRVLSKEDKIQYGVWAMLHDIWKTLIPSEIINKPWKLTSEEFAVMKQHSILGMCSLANVSVTQQIYNAVVFHHERFNWQGYPSRLNWENTPLVMSWDKIPLGVRVITIADVFEALTADRPYRKCMETNEALETMVHKMDGHFDKNLLRLFIEKITGRK